MTDAQAAVQEECSLSTHAPTTRNLRLPPRAPATLVCFSESTQPMCQKGGANAVSGSKPARSSSAGIHSQEGWGARGERARGKGRAGARGRGGVEVPQLRPHLAHSTSLLLLPDAESLLDKVKGLGQPQRGHSSTASPEGEGLHARGPRGETLYVELRASGQGGWQREGAVNGVPGGRRRRRRMARGCPIASLPPRHPPDQGQPRRQAGERHSPQGTPSQLGSVTVGPTLSQEREDGAVPIVLAVIRLLGRSQTCP